MEKSRAWGSVARKNVVVNWEPWSSGPNLPSGYVDSYSTHPAGPGSIPGGRYHKASGTEGFSTPSYRYVWNYNSTWPLKAVCLPKTQWRRMKRTFQEAKGFALMKKSQMEIRGVQLWERHILNVFSRMTKIFHMIQKLVFSLSVSLSLLLLWVPGESHDGVCVCVRKLFMTLLLTQKWPRTLTNSNGSRKVMRLQAQLFLFITFCIILPTKGKCAQNRRQANFGHHGKVCMTYGFWQSISLSKDIFLCSALL